MRLLWDLWMCIGCIALSRGLEKGSPAPHTTVTPPAGG